MDSQLFDECHNLFRSALVQTRQTEHLIDEQCKILADRIGRLDKIINEFYHVVEFAPMSNKDKVKMFNKLRKILKERREAKEQRILFCNLKSKQLKFVLSVEMKEREGRKNEYFKKSVESAKEWLND